jgi:tetratricopeptide (TPR) repeat protein
LLHIGDGKVVQRLSSAAQRSRVPVFESFAQALSCHQQGRLAEAAQHYEAVLEADDRHFGAVHGLGLVRLQQGRFADAMPLFRRATKIERRSAEAHHHLAVALTGLSKTEEAIERFEKALALNPDLAEAHDSLGHALQLLGRYQAAVAHHERALTIKPTCAEAHNNLGNALQKLGRSEKAIAHYERALALRSHYPEAHNNVGRALASLGRHEEAIAHYESALVITPDYVDAHINLGNALGELDRHEEAVARYDRVLGLSPNNLDALLKRGHTLAGLERHDEAILEYDKALALAPGNAEALIARGNAMIMLGRDAEAAELLKRLINRGVNSAEVILGLASLPTSLVGLDLVTQLAKMSHLEGREKNQFDNIAGFVRATALDWAGRQAEAWEQLVPANRARFVADQASFRDDVARERASLERLQANATAAAKASIDARRMISLFILGPSRSGKTAMEKLVSTLPGVKRGYENASLSRAVSRASKASGLPAGVGSLEHLPPTLHSLCYGMYSEELAARAGSASVFTNTHPGRIHEADILASAFPNVRFILVKRNVDDNILRMYQRRYERGHIYTYDLKAAREHILWYQQMMDLLTQKFPEIVRIVHYEDMVTDPTAAVRLAAELCGLPMSDGPLPAVGDDRGCAAPYLQFMAAELER